MDEEEGPSRIPVNLEGYNQTYLVEAVEPPSRDSKDEAEDEIDDEDAVHEHRVLFRCGNWCYTGHVAFDKRRIALSDIPRAIPIAISIRSETESGGRSVLASRIFR